MDPVNIRVSTNDSRKKNIDFKSVEPINNIQVIRQKEPSDSESDDDSDSNLSDISEYNKPKSKKVQHKNRPVQREPTQFFERPQKNHDYSAFSNPKKISRRDQEQFESESEYSSLESSEMSDSESGDSESGSEGPGKEKLTFEEKQQMKQDLLIKIQAMEKKGFEFSKKFNMTSNYEEMMFEYTKVKKFIESQAAIKFSRRCLMACVTGIEFLNKKFDPFNVKLEGWSENVMESVDDYDNIFERLHEKYSGKGEIAPELELLLTLGGSAFMFHLTNSLLKSPAMGSVIAQNNPNFLQSMMGAMSEGMKEMNKPPNFKQVPQGPPQPMETRGLRKEMRGPTIDTNLFSGTPLATNYPQAPLPQEYVNYVPIDEDDRFSVASSDSSLSSVSVKRINTKKGSQGLELNIK
jgi:hypothetical protein